MQISDIELNLKNKYPAELCSAILVSYLKSITEFRKHNWKYSANEIGAFIENSFRIIQYITQGSYTPINKQMPTFNQSLLNTFENASVSINETFRIIIPRILYGMYCIRNKRGAIHPNGIDPNRMDAQLLNNNAKWILAELYRMSIDSEFEEAEKIIESIMNKEIDMIWDNGKCLRILDTKMSTKNKILCLLYIKNNQNVNSLQVSIEYKNKSDFKKILRQLHTQRLIEYAEEECILTPLGEIKAQEILNNN